MKRVYLFVALFAGIGAAIYYLAERGTLDVSDLWQTILSLFRRAGTEVTAVTNSDPYSKALNMIAGFEGFSAKAYPDADGYSIGYGHFITADDPYDSSSVISEADAYVLLEADAQGALACVDGKVIVPLTDNQKAALVSLVYNIGCGNFSSSTLLKKLNGGDYAGTQAQFAVWNQSGGSVIDALISRRSKEAAVFAA